MAVKGTYLPLLWIECRFIFYATFLWKPKFRLCSWSSGLVVKYTIHRLRQFCSGFPEPAWPEMPFGFYECGMVLNTGGNAGILQ
jgi:hypothetical protein